MAKAGAGWRRPRFLLEWATWAKSYRNIEVLSGFNETSGLNFEVFIETSSIIGPASIAKFDYTSLTRYATNVIDSSYPPKLQCGPSSDTKSIGGLVATQLAATSSIWFHVPIVVTFFTVFFTAPPDWNPLEPQESNPFSPLLAARIELACSACSITS